MNDVIETLQSPPLKMDKNATIRYNVIQSLPTPPPMNESASTITGKECNTVTANPLRK
jgi:hypothetical protein